MANRYARHAQILKVMGNPSRLQIIDILGRGEHSAGELTSQVGLAPSTVSKHLALLKAHGIVGDRRQGNHVIYRLVVPCVSQLLACSRQVLRERKR